jgi:hypothetical protein
MTATHENIRQTAPRKRRTGKWIAVILAVLVALLASAAWFAEFEYAYLPSESEVLNPQRINGDLAFDLWGRSFTHREVEKLETSDPALFARLSPAHGAVQITPETLTLGRAAFYQETWGNEEFATEVLGMFQGALTRWEFAKAILRSRGTGTDNLQVRTGRAVTIAGREIPKGTLISTGLDLPKGALAPMGMTMKYSRGRLQSGVTCAACHSTWDTVSGLVVEGAPNLNINIGTLLALASNSASMIVNAEPGDLEKYLTGRSLTITTSTGQSARLPDPKLLEDAVDHVFMSWPPGTFDSTADMVANPSQIPDSFTWMDHPYGWTGFASVGPFLGVSVLNNNVHALNSDGLSQAEATRDLFGFDKEMTYGIVLQHAANSRYRYHPEEHGDRPSAFFARVNPTPLATGFNEMVKAPTFPKGSLVSPDGLFISKPGRTVWELNNAMSAFQNSLNAPPPPQLELDPQRIARGAEVFTAGDCRSCHSGPGYNNHHIVPAPLTGASPSRATALANLQQAMVFPPRTWAWDTPVPLPDDAKILEVPTDHLAPEYLELAFAFNDSPGGYKVKGLIGLFWTPPYLHDGGVSVGPDPALHLGVPHTLFQDIRPHPAHSLRALIDRNLRAAVIEANASSQRAVEMKITGTGHEHWIDEQAGFSRADQDALIQYLFSLSLARQ